MQGDILQEIIGHGLLAGGEPCRGEYTGIKALMLAVLEEGIRDYREATGRQSLEATEWVRSDRRDVFSFVVICETLGLEPTAVRAALARSRRRPGA
jgi:hypothetical protein